MTLPLNLAIVRADSDIGMNRGVYASASSMIGLQNWLDITANNLANVNTVGYKSDHLSFEETLSQQLYANGGSGGPIGSIAQGENPVGEVTSFSQGAVSETGNPLDLALTSPDAMFSVQTPGGVQYTRDGAFRLNSQGQLVSNSGLPILDDSGRTITVPSGTVQFSSSGELSVRTPQGVQEVAKLGIYKGEFAKVGGNLFVGKGTEAVTAPSVAPNALEGSNVNPVEAMTTLIRIQRIFELQQKAITQQNSSSNSLLQAVG